MVVGSVVDGMVDGTTIVVAVVGTVLVGTVAVGTTAVL